MLADNPYHLILVVIIMVFTLATTYSIGRIVVNYRSIRCRDIEFGAAGDYARVAHADPDGTPQMRTVKPQRPHKARKWRDVTPQQAARSAEPQDAARYHASQQIDRPSEPARSQYHAQQQVVSPQDDLQQAATSQYAAGPQDQATVRYHAPQAARLTEAQQTSRSQYHAPQAQSQYPAGQQDDQHRASRSQSHTPHHAARTAEPRETVRYHAPQHGARSAEPRQTARPQYYEPQHETEENFEVPERQTPAAAGIPHEVSRWSSNVSYPSLPSHPPPNKPLPSPPIRTLSPYSASPQARNVTFESLTQASSTRPISRSARVNKSKPVLKQGRYDSAGSSGSRRARSQEVQEVPLTADPKDLNGLNLNLPLESVIRSSGYDYHQTAATQVPHSAQVARRTSESNVSSLATASDFQQARESTRSESSELQGTGTPF